ncbi:LysR substrate-binding domain-containing protein [Suttonella ornithocola]|nr:LysR substrate-binding domain-containing protein [Suttonella ornithocola]
MLYFRKYPSTTALQCFESAARHLSFTKAAHELHMTQSAVSKQVAQLEAMLQIQLFHRSRQRLHLSPIGHKFLQETQAILSRMEISVLNVLAHGETAQALHIACHPTLCARWFIPLLKGFGQKHSNIHLDISDQIGGVLAEDECIDMAFLYGDGVWPKMEAEKLFDEHCVAVCAPDLLSEPIENLTNLKQYTLIQSRSRPQAWMEYFSYQGLPLKDTFSGPRFDTFYACISAAILGCGIALVPKFLVQRELSDGRLIIPWQFVLESNGAYYMLYDSALSGDPKVQAMCDWVYQHTQP